MRRRLLPLLTFVAGVILASAVVAAASSGGGTAKACVNSKGQLRLIAGRSCARGTKKLTLNATGPRGVAGAPGARGTQGPQGPKGDPGTPDTSNFYTKSQSDARYTPISDHIDIPGQDFSPIDSGTDWAYANFFGIYERSGTTRQYMAAGLEAVPSGATITSVDFYLIHNSTTPAATVYLSKGNPTLGSSNGNENTIATATASTADPGIIKVTVTPVHGYKPSGDDVPLLFWEPGTVGPTDVLWSARVHYTLAG